MSKVCSVQGGARVDSKEPFQLCVIGNAKVQSENPITHKFSQFFITFIVDSETGAIQEVEASMTLALTARFVEKLFLGRSLAATDEELLDRVRTRYLGSSQRAIAVAYKDAVKKYRAWRRGIISAD